MEREARESRIEEEQERGGHHICAEAMAAGQFGSGSIYGQGSLSMGVLRTTTMHSRTFHYEIEIEMVNTHLGEAAQPLFGVTARSVRSSYVFRFVDRLSGHNNRRDTYLHMQALSLCLSLPGSGSIPLTK